MGIKIMGTGSYLPEIVADNEAFTRIVETSDEWIVKHSGIRERRINDGTTTHMAVEAAKRALESACLSPADIDLILCTTVSSDYMTPSMACVVQGLLGASKAVAFDINAACAGFVFALDMANKYLASGGYERILLISAESLSKITDYTDRGTCVLFGDGAGAVVLARDDRPFSAVLGTDGTGAFTLFARHGQNEIPFVQQKPAHELDGFAEKEPGLLYMDGHKVYKFAVTAMPKAVREACAQYGIAPGELDLLIPHQANIRIIQTALSALDFPMEKTVCTIDRYGNMSSACIPIALDEAVKNGRLKRGDKICTVGFGAGLVYGGAVFEY